MSDQKETTKYDNSPEKLIKVCPTLFIGVGGTGMEISLRVRRRILNYVWGGRENPIRIGNLTEFPLAQFINFDLDASSVTESGQAVATDPLADLVKFSDEEKLIFKLDLDKYLRTDGELYRFPHIASWFPLTRKKAAELGIDPSKGTGQIRSLSRLYFFDKYLALKNIIESKIRTLLSGVSNESKTKRLGLELEPASLRVVVLASTAGGTGAGSFLDMGYIAKWLADRQLKDARVDLALMLPSGFSGYGKSRTEANTYASLMELETCMREGIMFVKYWKDREYPELKPKPYDEIFLFDTGNLALKKTSHATDVFDMVADILFEDFTSAEFANRKRTIAPNQNQYKIDSFSLPINTKKYGKMKMMYSKAYSAFGQSIIDTQLEQRRDAIACEQVNDMLKVFFGIATVAGGGREVSPPIPEDGRDILKEHAYCFRENFKLAYQFVSDATPYKKGLEYGIYKLVDHLLYEDDKPMLGRLHDRINKEIGDILASTEKDQRLPRIDKLRSKLDRDLGIEGGATDAGARGIEEAVHDRRKVVFNNIVDEKSGLLKALWAAVDNKEKGGLDYTIQLIEQIKDEIDNDTTGLLRDIETAQKWFSGLCEKLRGEELQVLTEHIGQTKGSSLFGNKEAYAEAKLQQIGEAIRWYVEARLRVIACREAAVLLKDLSSWFGQHQGLDEKSNRKRWSADSFAGKLAVYEKMVVEIMSGMDKEMNRINEATKQEHASYQIVKASTMELEMARKLNPKKAMEWAKSVFDNMGGSRVIFQKLESKVSRAELIGQLRGLALTKLPVLGIGADNPLIKALAEMQESERILLFKHCLDMAMPWVEANLEGDWTVNPDQYSCIIGVNASKLFEDKFGAELRYCISAHARMTTNKVNFYETGIPGKLTCYVELSGVPLPALNLLSNWRDSYNDECQKIPVHTQKDKTIFSHPMAPSAATLDRLAEHFKLYIQGILLGVLKLRVGDQEERVYCLTVSGEELSIGNERTIRLEGVSSEYLTYLKKKVAEKLDWIKTPYQHVGLVVLYEFYKQSVYPPAVIKNENGIEFLVEGFGNILCSIMEKEAWAALKKKFTEEEYNSAFESKSKILDVCTDEIKGSETDVYENEVGKEHMSKRILKPEFFQPGWIETLFKPEQPIDWWVALDGKQNGPHDKNGLRILITLGRMMGTTKVWKKGMSGWIPANQVEELAGLFDQQSRYDEEPPPID